MGTTILGDPEAPALWRPEVPEVELPVPPRPALTRFHLALRFWNQIFTCTSDNLRAWAMCERSVRLRYFLAWNSRSSSRSCSEVKAVLRRRALPLLEELVELAEARPKEWLEGSWAGSVSSSLSADNRLLSGMEEVRVEDGFSKCWFYSCCLIVLEEKRDGSSK